MRLLFRCALALIAVTAACLLSHAQETPSPDVPALLQAGNTSYMRGDYEAARQSFLKAWDLLQQGPREDPARYDALKRLTSVRAAAGEFADADNYLQMAINWRETTLGYEDPKILDDLLISAGLCRGMKDYDRAFVILTRVLSAHVRRDGAESIAVADDYSRMAQLFREQSRPEDAARTLDAALRIRAKTAGPLDISLVPDLDRLGGLQIELRDYAKAEAAFRLALVIRETLYGRDDPDLLATLDGLAYSFFGQKKYEEAEPVYLRLLALWKKSLGAGANDHPMLAVTLDKVATFYLTQKKFDQARGALAEANVIRSRFLAAGVSEQATEQLEEGNKDSATALYRRIVKILDPPDPGYDELRKEAEGILNILQPPPKPVMKKKRS